MPPCRFAEESKARPNLPGSAHSTLVVIERQQVVHLAAVVFDLNGPARKVRRRFQIAFAQVRQREPTIHFNTVVIISERRLKSFSAWARSAGISSRNWAGRLVRLPRRACRWTNVSLSSGAGTSIRLAVPRGGAEFRQRSIKVPGLTEKLCANACSGGPAAPSPVRNTALKPPVDCSPVAIGTAATTSREIRRLLNTRRDELRNRNQRTALQDSRNFRRRTKLSLLLGDVHSRQDLHQSFVEPRLRLRIISIQQQQPISAINPAPIVCREIHDQVIAVGSGNGKAARKRRLAARIRLKFGLGSEAKQRTADDCG